MDAIDQTKNTIFIITIVACAIIGIVFLAVGSKIFSAAVFIAGFVASVWFVLYLFDTVTIISSIVPSYEWWYFSIPLIFGLISGFLLVRLVKFGIFALGAIAGGMIGYALVTSVFIQSFAVEIGIKIAIVAGFSLIFGGLVFIRKDIVTIVACASIGAYLTAVTLDASFASPKYFSDPIHNLIFNGTMTLYRPHVVLPSPYVSNTTENNTNVTSPFVTTPTSLERIHQDPTKSLSFYLIIVYMVFILIISSSLQYYVFIRRPQLKKEESDRLLEEMKEIKEKQSDTGDLINDEGSHVDDVMIKLDNNDNDVDKKN